MSNKPSGNMETVYQTEAQWTADTRVFGADVVAITTDGANAGKHKLFKGTGRWSTLSYVEDGGGGGAVDSVNTQTGVVVLDATDLDIIDFLLVYGAGTPGANGVYPYVGQSNSKPSYQKGSGNGSHLVTWGAVSSQWTIGLVDLSPVYYYNSTDDVATPDLATFTVTAGAGPVPTVVLFTGTVQQALQAMAALEGSRGPIPKVYAFIASQSGTDAPVVTVKANTLGGAVVWTYDSTGVYFGTLAGAFLASKTIILTPLVAVPGGIENGATIYLARQSDNEISITTNDGGAAADGMLNNTGFKLEVYP